MYDYKHILCNKSMNKIFSINQKKILSLFWNLNIEYNVLRKYFEVNKNAFQ